MRKGFVWITLVLLLGCAPKIPPMPTIETPTPAVEECAQECKGKYTECMALDIRPDYLLLSPRKWACKKQIQECYQSCLDKEKNVSFGKDMR